MSRPRRLLRLSALAALIAAGTTTSAQPPVPAPDPRYRIEIVVFAYAEADRGEEDFRHGRPDIAPRPAPSLYRLPGLELESLFEAGPSADAAGGDAVPGDGRSGDRPPDGAVPGAVGAGQPPAGAGIGAAGESPAGSGAATGVPAPGDRLELIALAADDATATAATAGATGAAGTAAGAAADLPDAFRLLRRDELELTADVARLPRRAYRVLGHVGWEQAGVDSERAVAIDVARLGITNPTGSIRFYIGRFRHLSVDLEYLDGTGSFWTADPGAGLAPLAYAEAYRLQDELNAIRDRDLGYIDHPLFGILIWITRAPETTPDDAAPGATAPGGPAA